MWTGCIEPPEVIGSQLVRMQSISIVSFLRGKKHPMIEVNEVGKRNVPLEEEHVTEVWVNHLQQYLWVQFNIHFKCLGVLVVECKHSVAGYAFFVSLFAHSVSLKELTAFLLVDLLAYWQLFNSLFDVILPQIYLFFCFFLTQLELW